MCVSECVCELCEASCCGCVWAHGLPGAQVSSLSAFFLLTLVPMVPIVAFLSFLQRQQSQVERIMGAVYMAFMVSGGLAAGELEKRRVVVDALLPRSTWSVGKASGIHAVLWAPRRPFPLPVGTRRCRWCSAS